MTDKLWVCDDDPSARYPVWTRGNVGEVFMEAVSPLNWSTFGRRAWEPGWREAFFDMGAFAPEDFRAEGQCEVTGCFGSYIYINMSVTRVMAVRVPGLTVEAMDKSLFGDYAGAPPYRADPRDANPQRTAAVAAWLQSLPAGNPRALTHADGVRLDALLATPVDLDAMSDSALLERFRAFTPEARHNFRRHVLNTYAGNVLGSMIAQICQAVGLPELTASVTAAAGDVASADHAFDLWTLSRSIAASPPLRAAFDAGTDGLLDRLRAADDADSRAFLTQWNAFIARWGCIGPSVWEPRVPVYRTHPAIALQLLDSTRQAPDAVAPQRRASHLAEAREAAIAQVAQRLVQQPPVRAQFLAAAAAVGHYLGAREHSKLHCARVIDAARMAIEQLGHRLVARGLLEAWEDVLLVNDDEADAFVAAPQTWRDTIDARRARLEMFKDREPPFVFEGEPPPLSAFVVRAAPIPAHVPAGTQLTGMGVSPGRYTGRARLIASLESGAQLEPGEIIVARTTDSSWGPLFMAAGAMVVETGALVSHAAIVARELGIPAAVSVADAMRRIPPGATITVDGNSGVVTVH